MTDRLASPITVWLLLIGATLVSYVSQLEGARAFPHLVGSAILAIAFVKVWLIGMRFMELKDAILPLKLIYNGWIAVMATALITLFWIA